MLSGLGFIFESLPSYSPTDPTYEAGKFMIQLSRSIWGGGKGRDTSFWLTLSRRKRGLCCGSVGLSTAPPTWSRWSADPGQEPGSAHSFVFAWSGQISFASPPGLRSSCWLLF